MFISCEGTSGGNTAYEPVQVTVDFNYGESIDVVFNEGQPNEYTRSPSNIYVVWMEEQSAGFSQNIFTCEKLIQDMTSTSTITGIALPYWNANVYNSIVDTVTGATQAKTDFTVTAEMNAALTRTFSVWLEIDRSWEKNDWFDDQPALLYRADINLDDGLDTYTMNFYGWASNNDNGNLKSDYTISALNFGELCSEVQYVTHTAVDPDSDGVYEFGSADEDSSGRMVDVITVTVTQ